MSWLGLTAAVMAVLLLSGLLLRRVKIGLSRICLILLVIYGLVIFAGAAVCWDGPPQSEQRPDFAVVLGYALENGEPKQELVDRLTLALNWLNDTEDVPLVVSGGDPGGQGVTEASVMAAWLQAQGADMSRVYCEENAKDTRENLLFSQSLLAEAGVDGNTVLILTNDYHQTRAGFWARQVGLTPIAQSCKTPFAHHVEASVREVYAFVKAFIEAAS